MAYWHAITKEEAIKELDSDEQGLSETKASALSEKYGQNEIKQLTKLNPFFIFFQQFKSLFILILLAAAIFSLYIGHYIDFAVIVIIVALNSTIGFFQQYKAEKTIIEMRGMLVSKVKVLRENKLKEIPSTDIVPGDILFISEGDKIMADCRIIQNNGLEVNEAVLTGESFPQKKSSEIVDADIELANRKDMIYMGTSVVKGNARAIVVETGMSTEFGKIAGLVQKIRSHKTPLEEKLDNFSKKVALAVIILAAITTAIGILRGEDVFNMTLAAISLAVSVIPEGLPAVIALTLAFAISRMEKSNALVRKLPAAETLGRVTVICADKTGTMTEEEMTVVYLHANRRDYKIKDHSFYFGNSKVSPDEIPDLKMLLRTGIMCNNARIEKDKNGKTIIGDPTEEALIISAEKAGISKKEETEKESRFIEYSFSSKRKMMSIVREHNSNLISYVKGAPNIILKNCTKEIVNGRMRALTAKRKIELRAIHEKMASNALRVLGFAYKPLATKEKMSQNITESDLIFIGFQGMLDPPRKEVKSSIADCVTAGIKVKMITGDSLLTAQAVSRMINLDGESIEAGELGKLSESDFYRAVKQKTIFARVTPEIKLRIIQVLKQQGEIVAVTGDGVNDVLALKEAHIGVSMGLRGTDVAREVSDIILLDDDFSTVVKAIREGRRVYDNMKKSIKFHLAANVSELFVVMFALAMAMPLPFMPLAILWMNLITDALPSLALTVEKEEHDIMHRKPISPKDTILANISLFILIAGIISFLTAMTIFSLYYQADLEKARTMALSTAVFSEMFLIFTCRSDRNLWKIGAFSNKFLVYSVAAAFILQITAIYSPLSAIFGFTAISLKELLIVLGVSSLGLIFFEVKKLIQNGGSG